MTDNTLTLTELVLIEDAQRGFSPVAPFSDLRSFHAAPTFSGPSKPYPTS